MLTERIIINIPLKTFSIQIYRPDRQEISGSSRTNSPTYMSLPLLVIRSLQCTQQNLHDSQNNLLNKQYSDS